MGIKPSATVFLSWFRSEQPYRRPRRWYGDFDALEGRQLLSSARMPLHLAMSPGHAAVSRVHDDVGGNHHRHMQSFVQTNLVSDVPGLAPVTDSNLVNPWGIAFGPTSPLWVADNHSGVSTLYDGSGNPQPPPPKNPLVVTIPPPMSSSPGTTTAPTGIVFNNTSGFLVSGSGKPAAFIFDTEDGTISAWNGGNNAVIEVDNSGNNFTETDPAKQTGAVYKGLAEASSNGKTFIYATNFRSGNVDVFGSDFQPVDLGPNAFKDPHIPSGYAPFGIQTINGNLYVTYAKQDAFKHDDVAGVGHGFVDVYDPNGTLIQRVASRGSLDSPWGVTVAPAGFGQFSGALLVGNFGNSHVNAFDLRTGKFLGQLTGPNGKPLVLNGGFQNTTTPGDTKGLWTIAFDNGVSNGQTNAMYFTSGINDETDGLFGTVTIAKM